MSNDKPRYSEGPLSEELERLGMPISYSWRPSPKAIQRIKALGFDPRVINQDLRTQFITTMQANNTRNGDWDSLFEAFAEQHIASTSNEHAVAKTVAPWQQPSGSSRRHQTMTDDWRPSMEMVELIVNTICDNTDYLEAQLMSFTSHFHHQQHPNWDQKFKQWINNGWNVYGHKKTFTQTTQQDDRGFIEKHTDKSWREGL